MGINLKKLHAVIEQFPQKNIFCSNQLYFIRKDGVGIYSSSPKDEKNKKDKSEIQSIGALLSGLWQAADALSSFIPNHPKSSETFRLSFGSSNDGLFVMPVKLLEEQYFLATIYHQIEIPSLLKNKLRLLRNYLIEHKNNIIDKTVEKNSTLFNNITDDEINQLFTLPGN